MYFHKELPDLLNLCLVNSEVSGFHQRIRCNIFHFANIRCNDQRVLCIPLQSVTTAAMSATSMVFKKILESKFF